ncbi:MAG: aminotransferase class I/II-fold pyridoxal phosphate-dependent enzyme [Candidatus Limnocylindrales bacterium]
MRIADFELERFFTRWEFAVRHLMCASDVEGYPMVELLAQADDETRGLWTDLRLGYTEATGHPRLRAEIAALYDRIEPDDVLVFSGAEEAIFCLLNVILGPGDHAIVTWPGYQSLFEVGLATGAAVSLHELHESDDWALDVDRIRATIRPETRLIVVNAPHNPTGMLPSHAQWRALTGLCAETGVRLFSDEVYRLLEFDQGDRLPAGADVLPDGVSLGVMSKSFAMAGLRIGWLASRDHDLLARCAAFKDYTTICASAPAEILALIGLRAKSRVLARSQAIIAANLVALDRFFEARPDVLTWVRPRAGSVGYPRLTLAGRFAGWDADRFAAELVDAEGVLLLPGSRLGQPGSHVRLGFGRQDLPDALAGLERFVGR